MHEYFSCQVCFNLHPACDAIFHLKRSSSTSPFNMKIVKENVIFLEYTSPTSIVNLSNLSFYSADKAIVYITKKQLEVVDYVTKFTGQLIKSVLELPGNTSYLRLITSDFKVDVDQSVFMLVSLFKYSVTNQKGRDILLL